MTSCQQRQTLLTLIRQSCDSGARLQKACALIGLDARTVQRWRRPENQQGDLRVGDKRRNFQGSGRHRCRRRANRSASAAVNRIADGFLAKCVALRGQQPGVGFEDKQMGVRESGLVDLVYHIHCGNFVGENSRVFVRKRFHLDTPFTF